MLARSGADLASEDRWRLLGCESSEHEELRSISCLVKTWLKVRLFQHRHSQDSNSQPSNSVTKDQKTDSSSSIKWLHSSYSSILQPSSSVMFTWSFQRKSGVMMRRTRSTVRVIGWMLASMVIEGIWWTHCLTDNPMLTWCSMWPGNKTH